MPSTLLFAINNEGRVFGLSTNGTKWREFVYLGLEFKHLSAVPHYLWAVGGDRQVYVHVHGLDTPIRIKEEAYENERWTPFDGFSKRLLPTDRYHFSNQDGTKDRTLKKIRLPSMAWQWEGDWHLELTFDGQPLDHDGWTYALDFPAAYYPKKQWSSCVRRRKWVRYRRYSALNSWCAIAPLHKDPTREPFIGVAVGGYMLPGGKAGLMLVWAVTAHGRVMFRTEVSNMSPEGQRWTSIQMPAGCEVSQLSVGPTGLVWAILWSGKALVRTGVTRDCLAGEGWADVDQPEDKLLLKQVSVGCNGLWGITRDNRVWYRKGIRGESSGVSEDLAKGTGWVEMIGNMASVSVGANDQVWAVGAEDRLLYFRTAVTQEDLTGKTWRLVNAPTQMSRTNSSISLFSGGQGSGTPREKRHRSWTSLNRHSGSHEPQIRPDMDFEESCHSAPAVTRGAWQKSTDGTSVKSYGSQRSSDSSGVASSLQEHTFRSISEDSQLECFSPPNANFSEHVDIPEVKAKEDGDDKRDGDSAYQDSSHPVIGFINKEQTVRQPTRAWSPLRGVGSTVGVEAHSEADSSVFDADPFVGIYSEVGEREEDDDHLYWADSEALWASVEAGACLVDVTHLPNWFIENNSAPMVDMSKPWRVQILNELKRRLPDDLGLEQYEKAVDTSSWVKSGTAKCLVSNETAYTDCEIELEWVGGGKNGQDCGTVTLSSPGKTDTKAQINMSEVLAVVRCSVPRSPRLTIFRSDISQPVKLQFSAEDDLEDWMAELSSVSCRVRNISGSPGPSSLWLTTALGDVFASDPSYLSIEQCTEANSQHSVELTMTGVAMPYEMPLQAGFPPQSTITIHGCVHDNADRFMIDLLCTRENRPSDVAFHFNPRFKEDAVIRNAKKDGVWGPEDRRGCQPFRPGSLFEIEITCDTNCFKVVINGQRFTEFTVRDTFTEGESPALTAAHITHLGLNGDMSINKIVYTTSNIILQHSSMFWRHIGGHLRKVESAGGVTWGIGFDNTAWVYSGGTGGPYVNAVESCNSHPMTDGHHYYVYENQRWNPVTGFTSHGLPTDRFMWSDVTGRHKRTREKIKLLSKRWQWINDWTVDYQTPGGVDKDGWQYAVDFPSSYHGSKNFTDYVRRRRWMRKAKLVTTGPWTELGHTSLIDCSLHLEGDEIVAWAVAANGDVLFRRGVTSSVPAGLSWEHTSTDQAMISISSGHGQMWAISKGGSAFWRLGITSSNFFGEAWETVEPPRSGKLKQIAVGKYGVWGLDSTGRLSVRKEVTQTFPEGSHWQTLPLLSSEAPSEDEAGLPTTPMAIAAGGFRHMSAKFGLWAITSSGRLAYRMGVNEQNPSGSAWTFGIDANCLHISC